MANALWGAVSRALTVAAIGLIVSCAVFGPGQHDIQTFTGTVVHSEAEGGCLVLQTPGQTYELASKVKLDPGAEITVEGYILKDVASFCMMGPIIQVASIHPAPSD